MMDKILRLFGWSEFTICGSRVPIAVLIPTFILHTSLCAPSRFFRFRQETVQNYRKFVSLDLLLDISTILHTVLNIEFR